MHYNVPVSAGIKSKIAIHTLIPPINPLPYLNVFIERTENWIVEIIRQSTQNKELRTHRHAGKF
jgi:hypothetical protein